MPGTSDDDTVFPRRFSLLFPAVFAVVAAVFVGLFTAVTPVGFGLDEEHHIYRSWQVSRGLMTPEVIVPDAQYGGTVPSALVDYVIEGTDASNAARGTGPAWDRRDIDLAPDLERFGAVRLTPSSPQQVEEFTNAAASTAVAYVPTAVGMRIGTVLDLDVAGIVLIGKLFNGAIYVAIVTLAVFALRRSRWVWLAAVVALLPLSIFQASVVSADTMSNAMAILLVASVLALRERRRRAPWWLFALALGAGVGIVVAKPTYILLVALLLAVPRAALGMSTIGSWAVRGGAVLGLLGLGAFLSARASSIATAIRMQVPDWTSVDRQLQLAQLVADPVHAVGVVVRTFIEYGIGWVESSTVLLGLNMVFVPQPWAVTLVIAMVLAAFWAARPAPIVGAGFVTATVATVVLVILTLYMTYTVVGAASASGVQGRYWIPLFIPLFAGLAMLLPIRVVMSTRSATVLFGSVTVGALATALVMWSWTVY